jgi:hypothetical protein
LEAAPPTASRMSIRQIHFGVEPGVYDTWDRYRRNKGFGTLKDFIVHCVDSVMFPIAPNKEGLDAQLRDFEDLLQRNKSELGELLQQREQLFDGHGLKIPSLEERVIDYLRRSGKSNEYLIAQRLNEQSNTIYHVCAKLKKENRIQIDAKGNWYL